jgi:hypothetical protein
VNTWKVILATMVIFATGVLTGSVLTWRLHRSVTDSRPRAAGARWTQPPSPGGQRLEFLRKAQRELDLSVEQRQRVDKILKESQERSRKLMEPVAPQLRQEIERTKQEFRQQLDPRQQAKFDELMKKSAHPPRRAPQAAAENNQ